MSGAAPALRFRSAEGRWVLLATILGSAVVQIEGTVVNVALPAIGNDLGASISDIQWILNGYMITLAALILLGGSFGDRFGRRRVFQIGTVWFTSASLLCAVAPNVELLIAARVLQGIGGALLTPGSLAILEASFQRSDRARAIGAWAAFGGIGAAIGPLIGGWLIDAISWRAIFLINVPIAGLVVYAAQKHIPETRNEGAARLDIPGAALAVLALAGITFGLIGAPDEGIGAPGVLIPILIGLGAGVAFVLFEMRSREPMLPPEIFRNRQFDAANLLTFVVYGALGGVFFLFTVFLQTSLGYSPLAAGAATLPITILLLVLSERSGAFASKHGPRALLSIGPVLIGIGIFMLGQIDSGDYLTSVLPPVLVFGLGLAATVAPVTSTVLAAAEDRFAGVASGVNNAVARAAALLAIAVLPWVAGLSGEAYDDPAAFADGFQTAMWVVGAIAILGGVVGYVTISNDILEDEEGEGEGEPGELPAEPDSREHLVPRSCPITAPPPCTSEQEAVPVIAAAAVAAEREP